MLAGVVGSVEAIRQTVLYSRHGEERIREIDAASSWAVKTRRAPKDPRRSSCFVIVCVSVCGAPPRTARQACESQSEEENGGGFWNTDGRVADFDIPGNDFAVVADFTNVEE